MPRFFFNVYDGYSSLDSDGTELPHRQSARREAIRLAGNILDNEADRLLTGEAWHMEVANETGAILFRLDFSLTEPIIVDKP